MDRSNARAEVRRPMKGLGANGVKVAVRQISLCAGSFGLRYEMQRT